MRNFLLVAIFGIFSVVNYYVSNKYMLVLNHFFSFNTDFIVRGIVAILTLFTAVTYLLSNYNVGNLIGKLGTYWFGISLVSFFIFLLSDIILFLLKKITPISNQQVFFTFLLGSILILGLLIYGRWNANQIKLNKYDISIRKKSKLDNLNVILVSDFHIGYLNDDKKLKKIVSEINKLSPDIVCISGDLFDGNFKAINKPSKVLRYLNEIESTYGSYISWGNHDAGDNFQEMKSFIQESNLILLEDEIFINESNFAIIGRKDLSPIGNQEGIRKKNLVSLEHIKNIPIIVLDHQPSSFNTYEFPVDLVLSGHTHQGQVFPFNLVTKNFFDIDYGYGKNKNGTQMVVSSGIGTWGPPIRIGTSSEIVQLNISISE